MDRLDELAIFVRIVEEGSLVRAAAPAAPLAARGHARAGRRSRIGSACA